MVTVIHCYGAVINCHGALLHYHGTVVHLHCTSVHCHGTVGHMHGTVLYDHGKVISVDDTVEYLHGTVLQSNNIYIVVVLFYIPNTDSMAVHCYSGIIDLHATVLHVQSTVSGSMVTVP